MLTGEGRTRGRLLGVSTDTADVEERHAKANCVVTHVKQTKPIIDLI